MKIKVLLMLLATLTISLSSLAADKTVTPAKVFIIEPANGATVPTTFTVKFGSKDVEIVPAGTDKPNAGHHHLLIDMETLPDLHAPLPASSTLIHFGKGQTETQVTLAPGKHTLQLLLANYIHVAGDKPIVSEKITVTVK